MATNETSQELLNSIIQAHGGLERWQRIEKIEVTFNFHGSVLEIKTGTAKPRIPTITVNTHGEPYAAMTSLDPNASNPDNRWIFTPNQVSIQDATGATIRSISNPRSSFQGHNIMSPWNDLQLTYFLSYAMHNYLTYPFIFTLPGFQVTEKLPPHHESGETWRVLEVVFPESYPAHCRTQLFYFDSETYQLRRNDYAPDVIAGRTAAHYCFDYKTFGGVAIPVTRRVVRREGADAKLARTSFGLEYWSVKVFDSDGRVHEDGEWVG